MLLVLLEFYILFFQLEFEYFLESFLSILSCILLTEIFRSVASGALKWLKDNL